MARLFFKGIPEGPTCSSCGRENPKYSDEDGIITVCDERCYVEWYVENAAPEFAKERFYEHFYELD